MSKITPSQIVSGGAVIASAVFQDKQYGIEGVPSLWVFEAIQVPSTGVALTNKIIADDSWGILAKQLIVSEDADYTITVGGEIVDTFGPGTKRFDWGFHGLLVNPMESLTVTHGNVSTPVALITLVCQPVLISHRSTWY